MFHKRILIAAIALILSTIQCLYAHDASSPLPNNKIFEYPFNMVGKVFSPEGTVGSGTAVSQKVVLTAAHVFFDEVTIDWQSGQYGWNRQHAPDNRFSRIYSRSYRFFTDYAEATRIYQPEDLGLSSYEQFNLDVITLLFYEDVANGGHAGIASDSMLENVDKMIVGYPDIGYGPFDSRHDTMHSTSLNGSLAVFTFVNYNDRLNNLRTLYESDDLSSGPGNSGGPVYGLVTFSDGSVDWGVIGVTVAGETGVSSLVVGINQGVFDLIIDSEADTEPSLVVEGSGDIAGENIVHPNGNIFNQVLLTGQSVTISAEDSEITRVSFLDENDDIVQVEFSGSGELTITLDPATYVGPSLPIKYNQNIAYVKGRASIEIEGASDDSFLSIFTVGSINAVNQSLFPSGVFYDGMADVALLEITGSGFGSILGANARFSNTHGSTGILAGDVAVRNRVIIGDIDARGTASPFLVLDRDSTLGNDQGAVLIAGGDLFQSNGNRINVTLIGTTFGFSTIRSVSNFRSDGSEQPARNINASFSDALLGNNINVPILNPLESSQPIGFAPEGLNGKTYVLTFFSNTAFPETITFTGNTSGTFLDVFSGEFDGITETGVVTGDFSYFRDNTNLNKTTIAFVTDFIVLTFQNNVESITLSGTAQDISDQLLIEWPTSFVARMSYTSSSRGTFNCTTIYTDGSVKNDSGTFIEK